MSDIEKEKYFKNHYKKRKHERKFSSQLRNSIKVRNITSDSDNKPTNIDEGTMNLVQKKIQYLEDELESRRNIEMKEINDSFFKRNKNSSNPLSYPDILGAEVCSFFPSKSEETSNREGGHLIYLI